MVIFPASDGPDLDMQEVERPVPEIAQLSVPVGEAELGAPVTVAVKVRVPPRVGEPEATTEIVGGKMGTMVEVDEGTNKTALNTELPG